jgi:flagellar hook-associated protein 2
LQQSLSSVVTSPQMGSTGSFNQLSQVGITQNTDGTLAVNSAQLNSAISSDPNSVASLFQTNASFNALGVGGQVGQLAQQFSSPGPVNIDALSSSVAKQLQPTTSPRLTEQYNAQRFAPQLGSSLSAFSDTLGILKAQTNSLLLSGGIGGRFG